MLGAALPYTSLVAAVRRTGPAAVFLWSQTTGTGDPAALPDLRPRRPRGPAAARRAGLAAGRPAGREPPDRQPAGRGDRGHVGPRPRLTHPPLVGPGCAAPAISPDAAAAPTPAWARRAAHSSRLDLQTLLQRLGMIKVSRRLGRVWMPGRRLSVEGREEIVVGLARKESVRRIAARLGRAPSTVSREVRRNVSSSPRRYRAFPAHIKAAGRARRSRPRKLAAGTPAPGRWYASCCARIIHRARSRAGSSVTIPASRSCR